MLNYWQSFLFKKIKPLVYRFHIQIIFTSLQMCSNLNSLNCKISWKIKINTNIVSIIHRLMSKKIVHLLHISWKSIDQKSFIRFQKMRTEIKKIKYKAVFNHSSFFHRFLYILGNHIGIGINSSEYISWLQIFITWKFCQKLCRLRSFSRPLNSKKNNVLISLHCRCTKSRIKRDKTITTPWNQKEVKTLILVFFCYFENNLWLHNQIS